MLQNMCYVLYCILDYCFDINEEIVCSILEKNALINSRRNDATLM